MVQGRQCSGRGHRRRSALSAGQGVPGKIRAQADAMCISQTPVDALQREWGENQIDGMIAMIAGQEMGTKTEHIKYAAAPKYQAHRILMIGDAPGDFKAAKSNFALFYPINPGKEEQSWQRLYDEALDQFSMKIMPGL